MEAHPNDARRIIGQLFERGYNIHSTADVARSQAQVHASRRMIETYIREVDASASQGAALLHQRENEAGGLIEDNQANNDEDESDDGEEI